MQEMLDKTDLDAIRAIVEDVLAKGKSVGRKLIDINAAAIKLGRSVVAVEHLVKRGKIPTVRIDSKIQFDEVELDKFLESCAR